ncbi:MAG: Sterol 3-beta-glucosyltransferase [Piccolia ochrophora]|nr:MAG: Sterol 3-beta-glucosyltransferase [Piccolia ochrophora]
MAGEDELKKRVAKRLSKKRRDPSKPRVDFPDRFKDGEDAQEDVAAPNSQNPTYMNQSVFSMIAAAGSKTNFDARFDESSDSDDDEPPQPAPAVEMQDARSSDAAEEQQDSKKQTGRHRHKLSERKLLRSLPKLSLRTPKEKNYMSRSVPPTAKGDILSPNSGGITPREAPVMSRMLEAQAQLTSSIKSRKASKQKPDVLEEDDGVAQPTGLAARLMDIFGFGGPEDVIAEYPCWLLKTVLLQGYMYITTHHICFYAYMPKKSTTVVKSGYLSKRGRQNPKFNRYWFALKGDVLSYYADPANLYFPSGNIDLRYGISAAILDSKEGGKASSNFSVTTDQRSYFFKADSSTSAHEWVKTLEKVIFRSHNDGDSVKISLPIDNVIDIENVSVIDFAETFKIRIVDNDDTYAIDEVWTFGKDALNVLRILVEEAPARCISSGLLSPAADRDGSTSPRGRPRPEGRVRAFENQPQSPLDQPLPTLQDSVRATLSPISPGGSSRASPRPSSDFGRASFDSSRRSLELSQDIRRGSSKAMHSNASTPRHGRSQVRHGSESSMAKAHDASEVYVHSPGPEASSTSGLDSSSGTRPSASQILDRSDVFQSPTLPRTQRRNSRASRNRERAISRRHSEDSRRAIAMDTEIRIHPPSRSHTQQSLPRSVDAAHERKPANGYLDSDLAQSSSSPSLQELMKAGSYPLQRAAGFAGYLKTHSKKMSNLLATESMGYIEKVSGMWTGAKRHYDESAGLMLDDQYDDLEDEDGAAGFGDRYRAHFALPANERLQATYFGYLHRVLPLYGKVYIGNKHFCFRSLLPGTRTKMILPLKDIENVDKEKGFRFGYSGLVIVVRGHEELFFEFGQPDTRDDCAVTLLQNLEAIRYLEESGMLTQEEKELANAAIEEHRILQEARQNGHNEHELKMPKPANDTTPGDALPILFDDPRASIINFKPQESLRITCLTIGSRGDVQPYIALCKGLLAEGHKPKIATHAEFGDWVRKYGIDFAPVDGDPAELMRICVENGMFTYSFMKEASLKFRGWIDELLASAWSACQDSDVLIESPSAMAGIHIAEALRIPYFRAFTMPWTRTRAYPHAFAVPERKMGGAYNYFTYVMFDNVFWKAIAGQVNRWRKKSLALPRTNLDRMQPNKVPFLYNFSPSVVVPPLDYSDWIRVTGYWFLDEASAWDPPKELSDFIAKARADNKKIVYVGFGSIVVSDPAALTKTVIDSVLKADVRCILSKGWSDRLGNHEAMKPEVPLPDEILQIKSAPHDWLFRQIDAAAHHGGAGTTGASLRAGIPTIIKPFFGDQYFFGSRVEDLGVGVCVKKLNEDGVGNAIQAIYRDLEYARTLVKKRGAGLFDEGHEGSEESWTFVGELEKDSSMDASQREGASTALGGAHVRAMSPRGLVPP